MAMPAHQFRARQIMSGETNSNKVVVAVTTRCCGCSLADGRIQASRNLAQAMAHSKLESERVTKETVRQIVRDELKKKRA